MVTTVRSANAVITTFCKMFSCERKHTQSIGDCQLKTWRLNVMTLFDEHSVRNLMSNKPCTPKLKNKWTLLLTGLVIRGADFVVLSVYVVGLARWIKRNRAGWCFFFTVAMSMDAVASSMMRMLLLRTKALARQKSCRWPTLKFSPPSVTTASVEIWRVECSMAL